MARCEWATRPWCDLNYVHEPDKNKMSTVYVIPAVIKWRDFSLFRASESEIAVIDQNGRNCYWADLTWRLCVHEVSVWSYLGLINPK